MMKGSDFCGFFLKYEISKTESLPFMWDLGAGAGAGPPRSTDSAHQELLPPAQPGQGVGVLFICIWIAMVFVCLIFSVACSQTKRHRQHYHTLSCSGCEGDKGTLGLGHPPRGAGRGEVSWDGPRQCRIVAEHRGGYLLSLQLYPGGNELRTLFSWAFGMGFQHPLCWTVPSLVMATLLPSKVPWFGWMGNPWCH